MAAARHTGKTDENGDPIYYVAWTLKEYAAVIGGFLTIAVAVISMVITTTWSVASFQAGVQQLDYRLTKVEGSIDRHDSDIRELYGIHRGK